MSQDAQAPQRGPTLTALSSARFRWICEMRLEAAHEFVESANGEHRDMILTPRRGDVDFRHAPTV
ncbi:hypothetical protein G3I40_42800 [Streptomyces sp. SID14478]|uniref:hypothetical protein n=1 Tax=Streptomyces sp. SID14478 TaxID=2706073 RepID=UPI0013E035E0|nr:hypothetical protein [Streptomyces sp. SID14478]NEB81898.1 hypothetical protein [Streptomyces sp. SID14478]